MTVYRGTPQPNMDSEPQTTRGLALLIIPVVSLVQVMVPTCTYQRRKLGVLWIKVLHHTPKSPDGW